MSCQYKSRAAHLKLPPNDPKEKQGKKNCDQTQKETTQYTLMFKKVVLPRNNFTAQERHLRERHPTYPRHPETPRDTWKSRSGQKNQTEAEEEGRFGDSGKEEEVAAQLSYL